MNFFKQLVVLELTQVAPIVASTKETALQDMQKKYLDLKSSLIANSPTYFNQQREKLRQEETADNAKAQTLEASAHTLEQELQRLQSTTHTASAAAEVEKPSVDEQESKPLDKSAELMQRIEQARKQAELYRGRVAKELIAIAEVEKQINDFLAGTGKKLTARAADSLGELRQFIAKDTRFPQSFSAWNTLTINALTIPKCPPAVMQNMLNLLPQINKYVTELEGERSDLVAQFENKQATVDASLVAKERAVQLAEEEEKAKKLAQVRADKEEAAKKLAQEQATAQTLAKNIAEQQAILVSAENSRISQRLVEEEKSKKEKEQEILKLTTQLETLSVRFETMSKVQSKGGPAPSVSNQNALIGKNNAAVDFLGLSAFWSPERAHLVVLLFDELRTQMREAQKPGAHATHTNAINVIKPLITQLIDFDKSPFDAVQALEKLKLTHVTPAVRTVAHSYMSTLRHMGMDFQKTNDPHLAPGCSDKDLHLFEYYNRIADLYSPRGENSIFVTDTTLAETYRARATQLVEKTHLELEKDPKNWNKKVRERKDTVAAKGHEMIKEDIRKSTIKLSQKPLETLPSSVNNNNSENSVAVSGGATVLNDMKNKVNGTGGHSTSGNPAANQAAVLEQQPFVSTIQLNHS